MVQIATSSRRRSALETAACLYRYDKIYNLGVVDQGDFALRGIGYHACKKRYVDRLFQQRLSADAEEAALAFTEGVAIAQTPAHLVAEIRELFDAEAERFELDVDAYVLSEERLTQANEDEFTPDLVYARGRELEVKDDKTYFRILSEREAKRALQGRFYIRHAMTRWPGFDAYRFTYRFVRYGKEVSVVFEADELDALDRDVAAINASIDRAHETASWPATPGDTCGYCTLPCPVVDAVTTHPVRFLTPADAEKAGGEYVALLQALGARRKALETYVALHGPVDVGGVTFSHKPTSSKKFDGAAVVDALRALDVQPSFLIGTTAVKSYLTAKKWAHVRPAIEALAHIKTGSQFTIARSSTPDDDTEAED